MQRDNCKSVKIVRFKAGFCRHKDSEALKQAILKFCKLTEAERSKMRLAARNRVQAHFNAHKQGLKLSSLIEQVAYES